MNKQIKNKIQIFDPRNKKWAKIDIVTGKIVYKSDPKPWKNIETCKSFFELYKIEAKNKIKEIFNELREEYKYGGGEDMEGNLEPGYPDFDRAEQECYNIFMEYFDLMRRKNEKQFC